MKILVTGATGMLGRAVMKRFAAEKSFDVTGLCHTRKGAGLCPIDLSDTAAVDAFLNEMKPDVIIHTAAIRKPDEFSADVSAARNLNVTTTAVLARWTAAHGAFLVFISSDYVFDGACPPYFPDSPVHAINEYGQSKVDAEAIVRSEAPNNAVILRVPVLYGDVENLAESSVTSVLAAVLKRTPVVLDDWAVRYPTHVADVADILAQIVVRRTTCTEFAGTYQWSGAEPLTKFDMGCAAARLLGSDPSLLSRSGAPANGSAPRPKDCHLDRGALEALGITTPGIPFEQVAVGLLARFGTANA